MLCPECLLEAGLRVAFQDVVSYWMHRALKHYPVEATIATSVAGVLTYRWLNHEAVRAVVAPAQSSKRSRQ